MTEPLIPDERALALIDDFKARMGWTIVGEAEDEWHQLAALPDAGAGRCEDCSDESRLRWKLGRFAICGSCALSRLRAGFKVARAEAAARNESEAA